MADETQVSPDGELKHEELEKVSGGITAQQIKIDVDNLLSPLMPSTLTTPSTKTTPSTESSWNRVKNSSTGV